MNFCFSNITRRVNYRRGVYGLCVRTHLPYVQKGVLFIKQVHCTPGMVALGTIHVGCWVSRPQGRTREKNFFVSLFVLLSPILSVSPLKILPLPGHQRWKNCHVCFESKKWAAYKCLAQSSEAFTDNEMTKLWCEWCGQSVSHMDAICVPFESHVSRRRRRLRLIFRALFSAICLTHEFTSLLAFPCLRLEKKIKIKIRQKLHFLSSAGGFGSTTQEPIVKITPESMSPFSVKNLHLVVSR